MAIIKCKVCSKIKIVPFNRRDEKYCSRGCAVKCPERNNKVRLSKLGKRNPMFGIRLVGAKNGMFGKKHSKDTIEYYRLTRRGSLNANFGNGEKIRGKSNPNWRGGVSEEYRLARTSEKNSTFRKSVFSRDAYTCRRCGDSKSGKFVAHHILNFSNHPKLRFCVDNGVTLCRKCHVLFHHIFGNKSNNKRQLKEFLCT
jgi:5-methylcytosine-specific restriction endonuclease McrA